MELDEVLDTNWVRGMDDLMCIFQDGMFAELFLDSAMGENRYSSEHRHSCA